MTVYLDIILLENIIMNYIIIFATGILMKVNIRQYKIIISSIIGAIYAIINYLNIFPIYSYFITKIILSIVMIYTAFTPNKFKILIKELIIFYLTSFVFGGCAIALLYFVKPQQVFIKDGVFVGMYPIKIAILAGVVGFIITQIAFKIVKNKMSKRDMFCNITIFMNEKSVEVKAILDTGNLLKEPITGMPVIVVEKKELYKILPINILDNIEKIIGGEIENYDYISRFRAIPFSSLGKQNGLLLGFKADKIKIVFNEVEEKVGNAIIGIYDKSLTKNGAYTALVGLDILEGSKENEYITSIKG